MEHREETFEWKVQWKNWKKKGQNLIWVFPIDYSSREGGAEWGQNVDNFRNHVLKHPFFKDILLGLVIPSNEKDLSLDGMPPIPLEAMPLLDCFYQLTKQVTSDYYKAFVHRNGNQSAVMKRFWDDLCVELYARTAPPQDSNKPDLYAFCRHIFFQNERFASAMLAPVWKQEILPRYETMLELVGQVGLKEQMWTLTNCLMSLDSTILNLQSQVHARADKEPSLEPAPVTQDSVSELLKSLLSIRQTYKGTVENDVVYRLPNMRLADEDETPLEQAFRDVRDVRRHKKSLDNYDLLLSEARRAYLSHLAREVEGAVERDSKAKESLEFEQQYIDLQKYLGASFSQQSDGLHGRVLESCKQYCQQTIAYCTYAPAPGTVPVPDPALHPYKDDLFDSLIYGYMNQAVSCFRETIQLVAYYSAGWTTANNFLVYEEALLGYFESMNKANVKSDKDSAPPPFSRLEGLPMLPVPHGDTGYNVFYQNATILCPYLQGAWQFIYGDKAPLFDEGTYRFHEPNAIAAALWKDGESAARFFSREDLAFSSQEEARKVLDRYDTIVSNPCGICPPALFWSSIPRILQVLLLQTLRKVVEDSVPKLVEYIKPLLTPHQEPAP